MQEQVVDTSLPDPEMGATYDDHDTASLSPDDGARGSEDSDRRLSRRLSLPSSLSDGDAASQTLPPDFKASMRNTSSPQLSSGRASFDQPKRRATETNLHDVMEKFSVGSGVDEELSGDDLSSLIMQANLPPPPFANMFSCDNCRQDVGALLGQGRHHCRNCGGSFCASCSAKTAIVPFDLYINKGQPQRVCDTCYNRIKDFQEQAGTTSVAWSGLPPPSASDFLDDFELSYEERPLALFHCSFFLDLKPYYGHLFLTREHVCFLGYTNLKLKVKYDEVANIVKPQFYYINALQVKTNAKEKYFFAEFNGFRDMCFLRFDQLLNAYRDSERLHRKPSANELMNEAAARRRFYMKQENTFNGEDAVDLTPPKTGGLMSLPSKQRSISEDQSSTHSCDDEPFEPLPPDAPLAKMALLLDCELHADVKLVFEQLWGDGAGQAFLREQMTQSQDIDIDIGDWQTYPTDSASREELSKGFIFSAEDDYTLYRHVTSKHPPKVSFPGLPPYADCSRLQRFRVEKNGERWDRFVIADRHRMSKIPFSDYFEIETRWVFTRDGAQFCRVQTGLVVHFHKSTWFKSQINSSTKSESKDVLDAWAALATKHIQKQSEQTKKVKAAPAKRQAPKIASDYHIVTKSEVNDMNDVDDALTISSFFTKATDALKSMNLRMFMPYLLVLAIAYCLVLIRIQQRQLEQLSHTTIQLLQSLQGENQVQLTQDRCHPSTLQLAVQTLAECLEKGE